MGFPSTGLMSVWRNHIDEVYRLLTTYHADSFMIWNLSEQKYNYEMFNHQILDFPFPDHHSPPLTLLFAIVHSIDSWLQASETNVAAIHCKGGKGRTGLVIVCYLMYSGMFLDITQAAKHFAKQRSSKEKGVTQPSQVRYLKYFSDVLCTETPLTPRTLGLVGVKFGPVPRGWSMSIEAFTYKENFEPRLVFDSASMRPETLRESQEDDTSVVVPIGVEIVDDVLVKVFRASKSKTKEVCHIIFHTYFVWAGTQTLTFERSHLDAPSKKLPREFVVAVSVKQLDGATSFRPAEEKDQMSGAPYITAMRKVFSERSGGKAPGKTMTMGRHRHGTITSSIDGQQVETIDPKSASTRRRFSSREFKALDVPSVGDRPIEVKRLSQTADALVDSIPPSPSPCSSASLASSSSSSTSPSLPSPKVASAAAAASGAAPSASAAAHPKTWTMCFEVGPPTDAFGTLRSAQHRLGHPVAEEAIASALAEPAAPGSPVSTTPPQRYHRYHPVPTRPPPGPPGLRRTTTAPDSTIFLNRSPKSTWIPSPSPSSRKECILSLQRGFPKAGSSPEPDGTKPAKPTIPPALVRPIRPANPPPPRSNPSPLQLLCETDDPAMQPKRPAPAPPLPPTEIPLEPKTAAPAPPLPQIPPSVATAPTHGFAMGPLLGMTTFPPDDPKKSLI